MSSAKSQGFKDKNYLHSSSKEQYTNENKKTILFTISSERTKFLGINSPKEVQDFVHWKVQNITERSLKDLNKWEDIAYSYIHGFNIIKMAMLSKLINSMQFLSIF